MTEFEERLRERLTEYLIKHEAIDSHVPECPDVEEKWPEIANSYITDGAREFQEYPVTSLGWMMFMGMAMAYYWDTDWEKYANRDDYYTALRDKNGYDNLDDTVVKDLLGYDGEKAEEVIDKVAQCAALVFSFIQHEKVAPGTPEAFNCYIACLHQLYLAGMEVQLNAMGYHMTPFQMN